MIPHILLRSKGFPTGYPNACVRTYCGAMSPTYSEGMSPTYLFSWEGAEKVEQLIK